MLAPVQRLTSDHLVADLKAAEGFRAKAYRDTLDIWTVGYGHAHVAPGTVWTREHAEAVLREDIKTAELECRKHLPWWEGLNEARRDAVCELVFNMGWGDGKHGLSSFHFTLKSMEAGLWDMAAEQLLQSRWASQVRVARASRIANLLRTGARA